MGHIRADVRVDRDNHRLARVAWRNTWKHRQDQCNYLSVWTFSGWGGVPGDYRDDCSRGWGALPSNRGVACLGRKKRMTPGRAACSAQHQHLRSRPMKNEKVVHEHHFCVYCCTQKWMEAPQLGFFATIGVLKHAATTQTHTRMHSLETC